MSKAKTKFIFFGLSMSAYFSPILMIISIITTKWLYSIEKVTNGIIVQEKILSVNSGFLKPNTSFAVSNVLPLEFIEATYGLWEMCRISGKFNII